MGTPRFSVVTPVYETPEDVLRATLDSVRRQTFGDWELCVVDDGSRAPHVRRLLDEAAAADGRIRVQRRDANAGIVAASNDALTMASGEFVALLDHDDMLHRRALEEVDAAIRADPTVDYLYTDEDKLDDRGRRTGPFYKPDWSPERLRTQMYTCHLSVLRRALVEEVGGFDAEYEGSQDWDLVLRVTERARAVAHVPKVLYHWRMLPSSAAGGGEEAKPWAFEAGTRALQAHCERTGVQAEVERDVEHPGVYRLRPRLRSEPKVSIVIPTAGQAREIRYRREVLVEHCVRSIVEASTYSAYELVVVVDAETDPTVGERLEEIAGERLRMVCFEGPFSFSAKVNLGAAHTEGEHLLLLNDDMEVAAPAWIERMVMYSSIPEVGAVGGRLVLEDGRLQHVGVGFHNGLPGHPYHGYAPDFGGYGNEVLVARNLLAVTGACLMTRRELFERLGGLPEDLPVNYNDVDYCLKLRADGRRVVCDPDLVMYHFESSSRSSAVEEWEKEALLRKWSQMTAVDPYSNPNLRHGGPRVRAVLAELIGGRLRLPRPRPKAAAR